MLVWFYLVIPCVAVSRVGVISCFNYHNGGEREEGDTNLWLAQGSPTPCGVWYVEWLRVFPANPLCSFSLRFQGHLLPLVALLVVNSSLHLQSSVNMCCGVCGHSHCYLAVHPTVTYCDTEWCLSITL